MSVKRLEGIPGFSIDRVAAAAGTDPTILRLENLDTDLLPPPSAIQASRDAIEDDDSNSYLPFTGRLELCRAISDRLYRDTAHRYDPETEVVITSGGTEGILDTLLATTDIGDEVILTDPTYAGMLNRVRLAGAVPKLVPFRFTDGAWRLDLDALQAAVTPRTKAFLLMSPSMPSGALLNRAEWEAVAALCIRHDLWLIYDAAMEKIVFKNHEQIHPASLPNMAERTITIGSVSKEYRMIGWRLGWVVAPAAILRDIALVHIYNVVTPTGLTQLAAMKAIREPEEEIQQAVAEWEKRHDVILRELEGLPILPAAGGWSLLLDVGKMGYDSFTASDRLLDIGKIAATPMRDWGQENSDQFVRLVFSNEPVERLQGLRERVLRALPPK